MGYRSRHTDICIRTLLCDQFAVAAEAVVQGSVHEGHCGDFRGPRSEWWRCTLLLSTELRAEDALRVTRELIAVEEAGDGPAFDADRHALQVSTAVRYLQEHLQRVLAGAASSAEHSAALMVVRAVRVAKARVGMGS